MAGPLGIGLGIWQRRGGAGLVLPTAGLAYDFDPEQLATADGAAAVAMTDSSGNGRDFTQGTAANRALMRFAGGPNGLKNIEFDGSNDHYTHAGGFLATSAQCFIVLKLNNHTPSVEAQTGLHQFGSPNADTHYSYTDGAIYESWGTTVRKDSISSTRPRNAWHIYSVRSAAGSWVAKQDNFVIRATGTNTTSFAGTYRIGNSFVGALYHLAGRVARYPVYSPAPDAGAEAAVWAYLFARYNLSAWDGGIPQG